MGPERWREIERLFDAARGLPESEWSGFLESACQDPGVRAEVERLLAHRSAATSFLQPPAGGAGSSAAPPMDWLIGERFGDFVIEERLGSGGMGVVFRARQLDLGRIVAVKVLDPGSQPVSGERFRREALAASRLEHRHIAAILAYGDHRGLSYYAMQFVDGWSLRRLLDGVADGGPDLADPRVAARLIREAADALDYSHRHGVIHRDIKPQNLLVTRDTHELRLIDFGLAKVASMDAISRTGDAAGTPLYMSPEQILAESAKVDHRTDVYSIGAVLYEILAGSPPFPGANVQQILYRITHERPRWIHAAAPNVPRELETIAMKALRREREDRYGTAGELRDDLDHFLAGRAISARPPSLAERCRDALGRPRTWKAVTPVLVVCALVLGVVFAGRPAAASALPARLDVELPAGATAATADIARIDPVTDAVTPVHTGVALPIDGALLETGIYRVTIFVPGVGLGEYERLLTPETPTRLAMTVRPRAQVLDDMLPIPGGTYTVGGVGVVGLYGEVRRTVAAFLMDRCEVSHARYRRFLLECPDVDAPWAPLTYDPAWDDKPVVGVQWDEAVRFAEWEGKRLPTWTEWQAAARGPTAFRFPWGDEPRDIRARAVVGRPKESTWQTQTIAVDRDIGDVSPFGVLHMFGNVFEWTSSPKLDVAGRRRAVYGDRLVQGFRWCSVIDNEKPKDLSLTLPAPRQWRGVGIRLVTTSHD